MAGTQIFDVVVPQEFTNYVVQNSVVLSAFSKSGIMVQNCGIASQLNAESNQFAAPSWNDYSDAEGDITPDDPSVDEIQRGQPLRRRIGPPSCEVKADLRPWSI